MTGTQLGGSARALVVGSVLSMTTIVSPTRRPDVVSTAVGGTDTSHVMPAVAYCVTAAAVVRAATVARSVRAKCRIPRGVSRVPHEKSLFHVQSRRLPMLGGEDHSQTYQTAGKLRGLQWISCLMPAVSGPWRTEAKPAL